MGQQFRCPECVFEYSYKRAIVTNQKSVHIGQKFQCPEYDHQATQKGNLIRHQKSVYGLEVSVSRL